MNDEHGGVEEGPVTPAVATALSKLELLESAPLEEHSAIFEDVRVDLRSALDAD